MKKLSSYFQQLSSKGEPAAKKSREESTVDDNPVAVGKLSKKRNSLDGYNTKNVDEAVKLMIGGEGGKWKEIQKIKIAHTILIRDWSYNEQNYREWFICPVGMIDAFSKRLAVKSGYANANVLSPDLKSVLHISEGTYNKEEMNVKVSNIGNLGVKEYYHISCKVCKKDIIPHLLHQYRSALPQNPTHVDLINNWDRLKVKSSLMDLAGCFIPLEEHVNAGPNGRRFIVRPCEHPPFHTKVSFSKPRPVQPSSTTQCSLPSSPTLSTPESSQSSFSSQSSSSQPHSIIIADEAGSMKVRRLNPSTDEENSTPVVTLAKNINVKMKPIDSLLDPKTDLATPCRDDIDQWSKEFMVEVIHTGARKLISNETSLEFYSKVMDGVRGYHNVIVKKFEFPDGQCLPPPPKVTVHKDNIGKVHKCLFKSYKDSGDPENPYNQFMHSANGEIYSIMHDGIQKFNRELNGVVVRYVTDDLDVINLPWMLEEIPGGSLNSDKLISHLFHVMSSIQQAQSPSIETADKEITRILLTSMELNDFPKPPEYFKCCRLLSYDLDPNIIELEFLACPILVSADGCSTNTKAGREIVEKYGFVCLCLRCAVHAADGTLKRMAKSKTMSVQAVVDFLVIFRKIMKHFQNSGKSTAALNAVLVVMHMKKVHMVSFCPTRMAYLLTSCAQGVELLGPVCDVLITLDVKKEQRDYFLGPESMIIMHILADVEPVFKKNFLKVLDTDDCLIIDVFRINEDFHKLLSDGLEYPKLDKFLSNLSEDDDGNVILEVMTGGNIQTITLNVSSKSNRARKGVIITDKIQLIRNKAEELKNQITANMMENVEDQSQADTIVEYSSAFDMHRTCLTFEERIEYVQQLSSIYCTDYVHHIEEEGDPFWDDYDISISYPEKIGCDVETLLDEYRNLWSVCNKSWKHFQKDKKDGNRQFWKKMASLHRITHPHLFQLVDILFAMAPSTGFLERSYSKLAKICFKDRNKLTSDHLQYLYFLGILNNEEFDYKEAVKLLETLG